MQISMDVDIDFSGIKKKFSKSNIDRGMFAMMETQALPDMTNYVPLDGGELRMSGHREDSYLVWDTPYADAQYYGTNGKAIFSQYTTPDTGPTWDEVAKAHHINDWTDAFIGFADLK